MKNTFFALLISSTVSIPAYAGNGEGEDNPIKKQTVYSIVKQKRSLEWYQAQEGLWEAEVQKNPKSGDAWLNLYTASRMIKIMGGNKKHHDLVTLVDRIEKAIPNSFEFHYIKYWNGNNGDESLFKHLERAYELGPEKPMLYDDFVTYYELNRDLEKRQEFCKKWFNSNDMSPNLYAWSYNLLHSVEEDNGILLTHGDNDTYPLWVLQETKKVKPNVAVLNVSLLWLEGYRNKRFKELGIPEMTKKNKDFTSGQDGYSSIINHLIEHAGRAVYFSTTIQPKWYEQYQDDVYLVGLAYKWSDKHFDNIAVLKKNFEKSFVTDYLKTDFFNDISESVMDHMNATYLAPLITLHNHYEEAGDEINLASTEHLITRIAEKSDREKEVEKIIHPGKSSGKSEVLKNSKDAMYGMVKINAKLYASQTEISNRLYNRFLLDLMKTGQYDDLKKATPEQVDWNLLVPSQFKDLNEEEIFEHGAPNDDETPICNISYEAANMYCTWLTNFYNNVEEKRKPYKKVKFYLPTEEQWQNLAFCGEFDGKRKYPWGFGTVIFKNNKLDPWNMDTIINGNGCYLANINTYEGESLEGCVNKHDGGIFAVKVNSYHPNNYGLYCMTGNVAEMVQEEGIAKGGSWNTPADKAYISNQQKYDGPSPEIGFRIVMEVIEE